MDMEEDEKPKKKEKKKVCKMKALLPPAPSSSTVPFSSDVDDKILHHIALPAVLFSVPFPIFPLINTQLAESIAEEFF